MLLQAEDPEYPSNINIFKNFWITPRKMVVTHFLKLQAHIPQTYYKKSSTKGTFQNSYLVEHPWNVAVKGFLEFCMKHLFLLKNRTFIDKRGEGISRSL